jgi:hypothetical protein
MPLTVVIHWAGNTNIQKTSQQWANSVGFMSVEGVAGSNVGVATHPCLWGFTLPLNLTEK